MPRRPSLPLLPAAALLLLAACGDATGPPRGAGDLADPWVTADPSTLGIDPARLDAAAARADALGAARSLVVAVDGRLVLDGTSGAPARTIPRTSAP